MTSGSYDFAGYQVLVVGGTRGEGHTIATSFAEAGASVTVTGTMMLRALYDTDLSPFDYESVNLARQESIDHLVGDDRPPRRARPGRVTANLPYGLPPDEQAFVAQAARSGLLGPTFLTTRLRLKLSQSPALGGGCVVNTGAVRTWLELSTTADEAQAQVIESTARAGEKWAGLGVRVNSVLQTTRPVLPRQYAPRAGSRVAGTTLVREQGTRVGEAVAASALFLASSAAVAHHRPDPAAELTRPTRDDRRLGVGHGFRDEHVRRNSSTESDCHSRRLPCPQIGHRVSTETSAPARRVRRDPHHLRTLPGRHRRRCSCRPGGLEHAEAILPRHCGPTRSQVPATEQLVRRRIGVGLPVRDAGRPAGRGRRRRPAPSARAPRRGRSPRPRSAPGPYDVARARPTRRARRRGGRPPPAGRRSPPPCWPRSARPAVARRPRAARPSTASCAARGGCGRRPRGRPC